MRLLIIEEARVQIIMTRTWYVELKWSTEIIYGFGDYLSQSVKIWTLVKCSWILEYLKLFILGEWLREWITPALSNYQDFKKDRNKWSMYSGPILRTDTGKYCKNLKTWRKSDFKKFWFLDWVLEVPNHLFLSFLKSW